MRLAAFVVSLLAIGCNRSQGQPAKAAPEAGFPQAVPAAVAASPQKGQAPSTVSGTVVETMDSGGYTYLLVRTGAGDVWAAVNQAPVKKGSQVAVVNAMPMNGFESKTLNKKFDLIYFGSLAMGPAPDPGAGETAAGDDPHVAARMGAQHAAAASGPADVEQIKVPKAEGPSGKTVAEIWAGKASLKDKEVAVRGKVVKYNAGIMGRNWVHLRDGSGSRDKQDDDITVTTADSVAVGDVVLARGTVVVDRDFGAGYTYPVILQDAKVQKK